MIYKILYWDEFWFPLPARIVICRSIEAAWRYADLHRPEDAKHLRVCLSRM